MNILVTNSVLLTDPSFTSASIISQNLMNLLQYNSSSLLFASAASTNFSKRLINECTLSATMLSIVSFSFPPGVPIQFLCLVHGRGWERKGREKGEKNRT